MRLYLVLFLTGVLAHLGYLHLPESLLVLTHPLVMAASGGMALAELVRQRVGETPQPAPFGRRRYGQLPPAANLRM